MKENNTLTLKERKRRKFLLAAPLLILPFVTLAFWALGGGRQVPESPEYKQVGINTALPAAHNKPGPEDKMRLYAESDRQMDAKKENKTAFLQQFRDLASYESVTQMPAAHDLSFLSVAADIDSNSVKAERKLADLQAIMEQGGRAQKGALSDNYPVNPATYGLQPGEVAQYGSEVTMESSANSEQALSQLNDLNQMIEQASAGDNENAMDSETGQINTMLDKILMIQHPEKAADSLRVLSGKNRRKVYPVRQWEEDVRVPLLAATDVTKRTSAWDRDMNPADLNRDTLRKGQLESEPVRYDRQFAGRFYDIDPEKPGGEKTGYTLSAVIAESQTLVSGGTIKLELTEDVFIGGHLIPEGSFVYGSCSLTGERLKVAIEGLRYKKRLLPVDLAVYDLDGMEGIRMPGAIGRDAAKQGADRALGGVQMMSLDPGLSAQAASAGIEAAKGLLSKKVKLIRVSVKSGYPVLLVDKKGLQEQKR